MVALGVALAAKTAVLTTPAQPMPVKIWGLFLEITPPRFFAICPILSITSTPPLKLKYKL